MSQDDCMRVLKRKSNKGKWITTNEISKGIKISKSSTVTNLLKLYKSGDVKRKPVRLRYGLGYAYQVKKR